MVALAIPIMIMLAVGIPALRKRGRVKNAQAAQRKRLRDNAVDLGSAGAISDPSDYSTDALLKALAVRPEDHGPRDGMPHDEGWAGAMLGLRSRMSSSTNVLEPHVYWGVRSLGQVFIRVGPDEKVEGGTSLISNRHVRSITVLRVDSPPLGIDSDEGTLRVNPSSPAEVRQLVNELATSLATWSDVRIHGGPEGIVASRDAVDGIWNSWAYDLWLLERIAERLGLVPLRDARIGPAWKVPYGMGKNLR